MIQICTYLYSGVWWGGNGVPTPFFTSNVIQDSDFFISFSACSAWSSTNQQMTSYLVYSTLAVQ